jgi:hypothetical protein
MVPQNIPFLVLPAGDLTYLLRDLIVTKWSISLQQDMLNFGDDGYYPGLRSLSGSLSFVASGPQLIEQVGDVGILDQYSVTDLLNAVNKKLRARDVR